MNKEQVAIYLALSDEQLQTLGLSNIAEQREVATHFANGGTIGTWDAGYEYELKSPPFKVGDRYQAFYSNQKVLGVQVKCNPPESKPLEYHTFYFTPSPLEGNGYQRRLWEGTSEDYRLLVRGLVFCCVNDVQAIAITQGWTEEALATDIGENMAQIIADAHQTIENQHALQGVFHKRLWNKVGIAHRSVTAKRPRYTGFECL